MNSDVIEGEARPLAVVEEQAVAEWTPSFVRSVDDQLAMLRERDRFYQRVLKPELHYGIIPGTVKPSLWKPGAEALLSAMALHAETGNESEPVVDVTGKDHNGEPFIQYIRWCRIYRQTGPTINDRIEIAKLTGACNSWEPKYRYRNAKVSCPECGKETIIKAKDFSGQDRDMGWVCWKKAGKSDGCGKQFPAGEPLLANAVAGKVANENVLELQNTILKMADKRALIAATLVATGCSDIFTQDIEDTPATATPAAPAPKAPPARPPSPPADESARLMGVSAVEAYARKHGLPVPATAGKNIEALKEIHAGLVVANKSAIVRAYAAKYGLPVPATDGKTVEELRAIYEVLVARATGDAAWQAATRPQDASEAADGSLFDPKAQTAPEAQERPGMAPGEAPPPEPSGFPPEPCRSAPSEDAMKRLFATLRDRCGIEDRDSRISWARSFGGALGNVTTFSDLCSHQCAYLIDKADSAT